MRTFDLGRFRSSDSIILSNSARGELVREELQLSSLDVTNEEVVIIAPHQIEKMTSSFVQGLFKESIVRLGSKDAVLARYRFELPHHLMDDLNRGLAFAEKKALPFKKPGP